MHSTEGLLWKVMGEHVNSYEGGVGNEKETGENNTRFAILLHSADTVE